MVLPGDVLEVGPSPSLRYIVVAADVPFTDGRMCLFCTARHEITFERTADFFIKHDPNVHRWSIEEFSQQINNPYAAVVVRKSRAWYEQLEDGHTITV